MMIAAGDRRFFGADAAHVTVRAATVAGGVRFVLMFLAKPTAGSHVQTPQAALIKTLRLDDGDVNHSRMN